MKNSQEKSDNNSEGVIKFKLNWEKTVLDEDDKQIATFIESLNGWRRIFRDLGVLGQEADRYDGLGFGNISRRTPRGFVITGSQTGEITDLHFEHYSEVTGWSLEQGVMEARGLAKPSSESLTHAAVYQSDQSVCCVFHVHSPDIWQLSDKLELPSTPGDIEYGSAAMADAVKAIVSAFPGEAVLAMKGHRDGVIAYGGTVSATGGLLVSVLAEAVGGVGREHVCNLREDKSIERK